MAMTHLGHHRVHTPDGVGLAIHDLGGSGPPVVFAHATGLHGLVWAPVATHLADVFRCISFDERGHGESDSPADRDFDWRRLAADTLAVVDSLHLFLPPAAHFPRSRPLAVGHSSGGAALLLAEQARPGTFRALYCFEPVIVAADPPLGPDPGNWLAAGARRRREVFSSRQEAYAHFASKTPFTAWAPGALAAYVDHGFEDLADGTVRLKCRGEDEALVYEMASAHDGFSHMDDVRCPVMLAFGSDTDAVGSAPTAALANRLPDAHIEAIPHVGHFGPLEDPAAVAASIRGFFPGS